MKHLYKLSLLLLALLIPATALSHDFEVDGIYYNINGDEATVTYKGTSWSQYSDEYSGDVIIPSTVTNNGTTYSVTSISDDAFHLCFELTSIDIPNSVTTIGNRAFEGTTWYNNQPDGLVYAGLVAYKYKGSMPNGTSITLRNGTLGIAGNAFSSCSNLTNIIIPNTVSSIGASAFASCSGLTSIIIPNSVSSIGDYAFSSCSGLTSIVVASGNPTYDSRNHCNAIIKTASNTLITGCMNTVIPNSVSIIDAYAFYCCSGLTSIDIPNSVTSIGNYAFYHCSGLTSIDLPNSVISIGNRAFESCRGLTSVTIPNSVTSISNYAFSGCSGLTNVTIPNSVTSIGGSAFQDCTSLTSITIPNSVISIGDYAFYNNSSLINVIIGDAIQTIGNNAFYGTPWYDNQPDGVVYAGLVAYKYKGTMPSNTSITLREGTVGIANNAFYNCSSLTSITIPNSVTSIGESAFYGCSGLTSITIGNSVTSIGYAAFADCSDLTSIDIPNSVASIGYGAFSGCSGLTSIVVASGNPTYDSRNNCNAIIETATNTLIVGCQNTTIPNSVTSIGDLAFVGCSALTSIDIPNSVTSIGSDAFYGCSGLTSVTIGNSVTSIGYSAFDECTSLTRVNVSDIAAWCNIEFGDWYANPLQCAGHLYLNGSEITELTIPNSVTSIGNCAFEFCVSLTSVTIPNSVTSIGGSAFRDCTSLTSITIPNSVTSIGDEAFEDCWDLTEIYCLALVPPTMYDDTFYGSYDATLYVPDIVLESYKAADYWNNFTNIVGMPYTFKVDGTSYHATTMNTASVMANNDDATLYTGDMVIPDSVTYSGQTFAVTGIENNAFDGCFELTSITIPNSVETIGEQAFQGCTGLTSVTIGSGVTGIGAKAFNYCNALETVKCLSTVPPVMASADCFTATAYNRATLLVPRQQIEAYQAADYWYKFAHIDGWGSAGRGDIDGDGEVSIRDVTRMIDAILTGEHEGVYFESADLNNNGRLDIGDVTSIIDMLLNGN